MAKPTMHPRYLKHYNKGLNDQEIAEKMDRTTDCVRSWQHYHKLPPNGSTRPINASVPMEQALTPEECVVIRAFLSSLVDAANTCPPNVKINISRYMYQWRKAYLRGEVP